MINWDRIRELRDEVGEDELGEVIELFCEEVEEVLGLLEQTAREDLPSRLHFLKGSMMNIGLDKVSAICRSEESRLKAHSSAQPNFAAIRSAYEHAKGGLLGLTEQGRESR